MNMSIISFIIAGIILLFSSQEKTSTAILQYVQTKSDIQEGGSGLFRYNGTTYLISVVPVIVGNKNEFDCKKVGETKAKREMLSYINGSEISSYTELTISEELTESLQGKKLEAKQSYREVIKERVLGTINQVNPLGGWYSGDKSVYYFAIYKTIEE